MERKIVITGAYNHGQKYGQHGMDLWLSVKGPLGATSLHCFTAWCLPEKQTSNYKMYSNYPFGAEGHLMQPQIVGVHYHSKEPMYKDQSIKHNCEFTDGDCYSDGSYTWGKDWILGFLHGGSDWVFDKLEDYYKNLFENGPEVDLAPIPQINPDERKTV